MASTDAYATTADFRRLKTELTASADEDALRLCLRAMSRIIDRKCGLPDGFWQGDALTARLYVGNGLDTLPVAPIAAATGLSVKMDTDNDGDFSDETAITYVVPMPYGADSGIEPRPFTELYLPTYSSQLSWTKGFRFEVTAFPGWPGGPPEAIKWATIEFTAMALGSSIFATGRINDLEQVVDASGQARSLIKSLVQSYARYPISIG